ncbi:hypothetical protein TREES_T100021566 [Tupaia chinensis]|uniref:Uncharacterized protein n=1 Tax=Tupaia chinensis TaxID=246437 RepID=L9KFE1_TUPCH|nr:hypothetical protein TREES_T100021566 [Tupaia chinensis]
MPFRPISSSGWTEAVLRRAVARASRFAPGLAVRVLLAEPQFSQGSSLALPALRSGHTAQAAMSGWWQYDRPAGRTQGTARNSLDWNPPRSDRCVPAGHPTELWLSSPGATLAAWLGKGKPPQEDWGQILVAEGVEHIHKSLAEGPAPGKKDSEIMKNI